MKKIVVLFLLVCGFLIVQKLCYRATDGFSIDEIAFPHDAQMIAHQGPLSVNHQFALNILRNNIFYYHKGGQQVYAFVTADKKYVLKLFKFSKMRTPTLFNMLPLTNGLQQKRAKSIAMKQRMLNNLLDSFSIADRHLKEESGLIFVHLNRSEHLPGTVQIRDRLHNKHELNLNDTFYVLQRYANPVYEQIGQWMRAKEISKARKGIHSLVKLALKRCHKGIRDQQFDIEANFGFIGEKAIQFNLGYFSHSRDQYNPEVYCPELMRTMKKFRSWLEVHHEELVEVLDAELERVVVKATD